MQRRVYNNNNNSIRADVSVEFASKRVDFRCTYLCEEMTTAWWQNKAREERDKQKERSGETFYYIRNRIRILYYIGDSEGAAAVKLFEDSTTGVTELLLFKCLNRDQNRRGREEFSINLYIHPFKRRHLPPCYLPRAKSYYIVLVFCHRASWRINFAANILL